MRPGLLIAAGLVGLFISQAAAAATIVLTPDTFERIAQAKSGDVVKLAAGAYPPMNLRPVVNKGALISVSPMKGAKATFSTLVLNGWEGFDFSGLQFRTPGVAGAKVRAVGLTIRAASRRIVVEDSEFIGDAADPTLSSAVWVRSSEDVTIRHCHFHDLYQGVFHDGNTNFLVEENTFHNLHSDGIRGGLNSTGTKLIGNFFIDSHQTGSDHLDAIQFWTTAAKSPTVDTLIEGNVYFRGTGDPAQAILIGDEGAVGYDGLIVRGNASLGSMWNGIQIAGARDAVVEDNFMQPMAGISDAHGKPIDKSWIIFRGSTGGVSKDNVASTMSVYKNVADPNVKNFKSIGIARKGDLSALIDWQRRHPRHCTPASQRGRPMTAEDLVRLDIDAAPPGAPCLF